ncbi:hypothetical protein BK645_13620 [Pseudomonas protegens]|nr:hypothetical protein BK645_13620 [Pseudomonas protegens]ROM37591.1 hypothetical protein BK646_21665 [Pseudomonas protegens]
MRAALLHFMRPRLARQRLQMSQCAEATIILNREDRKTASGVVRNSQELTGRIDAEMNGVLALGANCIELGQLTALRINGERAHLAEITMYAVKMSLRVVEGQKRWIHQIIERLNQCARTRFRRITVYSNAYATGIALFGCA